MADPQRKSGETAELAIEGFLSKAGEGELLLLQIHHEEGGGAWWTPWFDYWTWFSG
jgi:hypothetical protein